MIAVVDSVLSAWRDLVLTDDQVALWWLGQAGFLVKSSTSVFVVDPYLSDSLAIKYRDKKFKHIRMMPIPVDPATLTGIDSIFCTHRHTDHMDVGTLPALVEANPGVRLFAPSASAGHLSDFIGIDRSVATLVNEGDHLQFFPGLDLDVLASAHADLQYDDFGSSVFLGYVFTIGGLKIYHSGDCVSYDGLAEKLRSMDIDIALLPVNGRDEYRTENGIPGNFTFAEAVSLCMDAGIGALIPHHYGMFDFNTVDPADLQNNITEMNVDLEVVLPQINKAFVMNS